MKRLAICLGVALLVSACGSAPPRRDAPISTSVPADAPANGPTSAPSSAPTPPPPDNLDAIPDAVPRDEPRAARGNPVSYEVFGQRYVILGSPAGYRERGVASWYGPTFHARPTSSGEPYDMYAMTAAHKTLPIPVYARVTNLANGRNVVVRINDRGPFVANRIIDLSYTAAHKLDMTRNGTAFVEVEVITPGSLPEVARGVTTGQSAPPLTPPGLYVQAGAFGVLDNATQLAVRLRTQGFPDVIIRNPDTTVALYRVRIGPIADVASFDALAARIANLGIDARLVTE